MTQKSTSDKYTAHVILNMSLNTCARFRSKGNHFYVNNTRSVDVSLYTVLVEKTAGTLVT